MSNPNVIIHGRDPENRHFAIRTDEEGRLLVITSGSTVATNTQVQGWDGSDSRDISAISRMGGGYSLATGDTITHNKLDTLNTTVVDKHLDSTTDSVSISGSLEISNFPTSTEVSNFPTSTEVSNLSDVPLISGFATEETLGDIKNKTDSLSFFDNAGVLDLNTFDSQVNTSVGNVVNAINDKHLDSTTDSVTVSGTVSIDTTGLALEDTLSSLNDKINNDVVLTDAIQVSIKNASLTVDTGLNLSTLATEAKQDIQTEELVKIVDKKGDIEANIFYNQGAPVWADSVPVPSIYELDPNGWIYVNEEAGNAMNLYYFNGANEIKTLNSVVGQYAVVTNLSTKVNNSLIFAIYTKGSPFFTTRITHSPASGVNLTAGGKFLVYWGAVPDDIYPTLSRLNLTDVTTTGPAIPTEEILSVSLNTDSGAPAGDVLIFVESLGVVFSNGSINQSRVLNLLSNRTPYSLLNSTTEFTQLINTYLFNLNKTNGGLDVYIKNDTAIPVSGTVAFSNTTIDIGNLPETQPVSGTVAFSNTTIDIGNLPATQPVSGSVNVDNFPSFGLESTLSSIKTNTDKNTYTGNDLNVNVAAGSITVDSVKIKDSAGNNLDSTDNALDTYITNTSINTRNQDGSGNNITSTDLLSGKRGLDTASNLFCYDGTSVRTAITCDAGGKMNVRNYNADYLGNGISSTTTSIYGGATNSLDTSSSLYVSNGSTRTALTATSGKLDVNIGNTSVPISGTVAFSNTTIDIGNLPETQPVSGSVSISNSSIDSHCYGSSDGTNWHHLKTTETGNLITESKTHDGSNNPISSTVKETIRGLNTASDIYGYFGTNRIAVAVDSSGRVLTKSNVASGTGNEITSTDTTATTQSLDVASSLYTTDGSTRSALSSTAGSLNTNITNQISGFALESTLTTTNSTLTTTNTKLETGNGYLNTINQGVGYSYITAEAIGNATITAGSTSSFYTWTRGQYGRNTVLIYGDGSTAITDPVSVYTKDPSGGNRFLAIFYPPVIAGSRRWTLSLNLAPFNQLAIYNGSASTITGVNVQIYSA